MDVGFVHDLSDWIFCLPKEVRGIIKVGVAAVLWAIWKSRNKARLENFYLRDPSSIITQSAQWLDF